MILPSIYDYVNLSPLPCTTFFHIDIQNSKKYSKFSASNCPSMFIQVSLFRGVLLLLLRALLQNITFRWTCILNVYDAECPFDSLYFLIYICSIYIILWYLFFNLNKSTGLGDFHHHLHPFHCITLPKLVSQSTTFGKITSSLTL